MCARAICPRWRHDGDTLLIELELSLPPEEAARLLRLRRLGALKTTRARNQKLRIVWHDTPDSALRQGGLAAAEQRGAWRLEQLEPNGGSWPPGAPAPVLAEAPGAGEFDPPIPANIMPVAAFEGRAIALDLAVGGHPVGLRMLDGMLRGVTAEQRATRVQIAGDQDAVVGLALDLSDELRLSVPCAVLASEAIAVAQATTPGPRRLGAPSLPTDLSVPGAFAHVTGHLTDVMLYWGGCIAARSDAVEPVHQMRVAMRRLRSAIGLFPADDEAALLGTAKQSLRTVARLLGPARDWDVFCTETGQAVSAAFEDETEIARLMMASEKQRAAHYKALRAYLDSADYHRLMIRLAALSRPCGWERSALGETAREAVGRPLPDFAAGVLGKRLSRLLRAGQAIADLDVTALHEVRLLGKRMRYAAELFGPLYGRKATQRFIRRLTGLQETIGVLNDGAVAAQLMHELGGGGLGRAFAMGAVRGFVAGRGEAHRREIIQAWKRFRAAKPFWIAAAEPE